ncbi:MAG: sulfatase-like hydrolase/transferase [Myxococcota bacterium]
MILFAYFACLTTQSSTDNTEASAEEEIVFGSAGTSSESVIKPTVTTQKPARTTALIVIDTLRDDSLRKADTPNIDALANQGHRVEHAWAASTWTVPSVIGLLTGRTVREHGWNLPTGRLGKYPPLPELPLISEYFKENGIESIGIHANPYLAEELGFSRGFLVWKKSMDPAFPSTLQSELSKQQWDEDTKGFVYLHFIGPHSPLNPSQKKRDKYNLDDKWFETRNAMQIGAAKRNQIEGIRTAYATAYHAVIEDTDAIVGECIQILKKHDPDIRIVLTSDHGELLGEHNIVGHGSHLYEELSHVPLIVSHGTYPDFTSNTCIADWLSLQYGLSWNTSKSCAGQTLLSQREDKVALLFSNKDKWIRDDKGLRQTNLLLDPGEEAYFENKDGPFDSVLDGIPHKDPPENTAQLPNVTREQLKELGYLE